ncbi:MAG: hypothetical protein WDZ58_02865 [Gemmatimonadaceae bacterium]
MPGKKVVHGPAKFDPPGRVHCPRGSSVTDQKSNPADERVYAEDKTRVAQTETDDKESLVPRTHENPALEDLRRKREEAAKDRAGD